MTAAAITTETLTRTVARVLRRHYGDFKSADKRVARLAGEGVTPRAARNWLSGECPPSSATLLTLMRQCPELRAEINAMLDGDA
jgi:hypothetical protein